MSHPRSSRALLGLELPGLFQSPLGCWAREDFPPSHFSPVVRTTLEIHGSDRAR